MTDTAPGPEPVPALGGDFADGTMTQAELDHLLGDPAAQDAAEPAIAIAVGSNDVAALYVDGALAFGGDHYSVYLRAAEAAGIALIESDAFLLGRTATAETVAFEAAPNLALLREYERTTRQATLLRDQAQALLARAEELESGLNNLIHPDEAR